nr:putative reverse transcriptase, RNA-dependent DNA polymerase, Gag-polypeptide of LTR copia-type [Tanacetum cinerariifolium]
MNALLRNGTWKIIDLPKGIKAIGSKWIYKIKFQSSGEIDRFKARLVAQGFGQKEDEVVYMRPPEGIFPLGNKVCKLKKSLYGLKQAPSKKQNTLSKSSTEAEYRAIASASVTSEVI